MKKNAEALLVPSKETGLETNAEKTRCIFMSPEQNSGQYCKLKIGSKSFERVEQFKYLGYNPNKSRLCSGRNEEQTEVRECLLWLGAEYFFL
jgi:hypothetical protein